MDILGASGKAPLKRCFTPKSGVRALQVALDPGSNPGGPAEETPTVSLYTLP